MLMIEALISLAIVCPLTALFSWFIYKKFTPKWESRENYGYNGSQWVKVLAASSIIASLFASIVAFIGVALFISIAFGLLAFFLIATALTDYKTHLIPRELSNLALLVGFVVGAVGFATAQYYAPEYIMSQFTQLSFQLTQFGVYMIGIGLLFVLIMFYPAIGFGDIKMFWATGLFVSSFFVITQLLVIFMGMAVLMAGQMVVGMVKAKSWKISGGLPALPAFAVAFILVVLVSNFLSVTY